MPWYELRLRGRVESPSGVAPGFAVVEEMVTTVLCGRVDKAADIHTVLADVQALGLEVMEVRRVPQRPSSPRALRPACDGNLATSGAPGDDDQVELVLLELPDEQLPAPLVRAVTALAGQDLIEVLDVSRVVRLPDGTLARRSLIRALPKRVQWQLRSSREFILPLQTIAAPLGHLRAREGVVVVALRHMSPVARLETAAGLSGGSLVASLEVPAPPEPPSFTARAAWPSARRTPPR